MSSVQHNTQSASLRNGRGSNHNVHMSLPTSLIHSILSDWVDVIATIRLDFAFGGNRILHAQLLDIFESSHFYLKKVHPTKGVGGWRESPSEHPFTLMLNWFIRRQVKVKCIELNPGCWNVVLETYLKSFGQHVRQICPHEDGYQRYRDREAPTQNALIAKYCQNLTAYFVCSYNVYDDHILRVLRNNHHLRILHIDGALSSKNVPSKSCALTLAHLQQLKWFSADGFDDSLVALTRSAPNLQQLSLSSISENCTELQGALMLKVCRACPQLRSLSCKEMYLGRNDDTLKRFLSKCNGIVNLDLHGHQKLCDPVLIEALSELPRLHSLNLRGCSRLTDRTLDFLAQRFPSTLQALYLDHSVYTGYVADNDDNEIYEVVREEVKRGKGGYTSEGIANLRAKCTQLHTYHYSIEAGTVAMPQHVQAYQNATIVHLCAQRDVILPMILEHCKQMQILAMPYSKYGSHRVWLRVDQLMTIVACCPQLRTVVSEKNKHFKDSKDKNEVDYSAVREAFSKIVFVDDIKLLGFDALEMPF